MYNFLTVYILGKVLNTLAKSGSLHLDMTAQAYQETLKTLLSFTSNGALLQDIKRLEDEYTLLTEGYNAINSENESLRSRVTEYSNRILELQGQIELLTDTQESGAVQVEWELYPGYSWFAINADGRGYVHTEKPELTVETWYSSSFRYAGEFYSENWKSSLQRRPLDGGIPWDKYPEANWFAIDEDGEGYVYTHQPDIFDIAWDGGVSWDYIGKFPAENWKDSLQKRPENG